MLLVKTKIGPSSIEGLGLFADEFISKGTLVQKFIEGVDVIIPEDKVKSLSELEKNSLLHYAYKSKKTGDYHLNSDNARFLNHSKTPNLASEKEDDDIAARDIQIGEELTVNYYDFDAEQEGAVNLI